jgi:MFS transporter, DHA2 family, multidrug resistance protein
MCYTFWRMTGWTMDVSQREIITTIVIQGAGLGFGFTPLQLLASATLPVSLRASVFTHLTGESVYLSVL